MKNLKRRLCSASRHKLKAVERCGRSSDTMIDLTFLTEEEQETILAVLKRDADLKKAEEQRVQ